MRLRPLLAAAACATVLAAAPAAPAQQATGIGAHLACTAPADVAAIDAMLASAGSPLAGDGHAFVREGRRIGVDPRALVAIAAHETLLATYAPAHRIRNAFGLGPGWEFDSHAEAIARAATSLEELYLPEGRVHLADIGAKWAPVGAANDPTGLNEHWTAGVSAYYRALGGDPERPVLLTAQPRDPDCLDHAVRVAPADTSPAPSAAPASDGPPVITAWGGRAPAVTAPGPAGGADPATGRPAVVRGFMFPLALPRGARAAYGDRFAAPGPVECHGRRMRCAVAIETAPGAPVVASAAGMLQPADAAEREEGIGMWLVTADGARLGYGALAGYAPGVVPGARVAAGAPLGRTPGTLRFAWEVAGERVNPFPLLAATRSPAA